MDPALDALLNSILSQLVGNGVAAVADAQAIETAVQAVGVQIAALNGVLAAGVASGGIVKPAIDPVSRRLPIDPRRGQNDPAGRRGRPVTIPGLENVNKAFTLFATRVSGVVSPLGAMQAAMNSTGSGFGVLQKSVQVVGALLGTLLLPVFAAMAAGVLAVVAMVDGPVLNSLASFYSTVLKGAVDIAGGVGDIITALSPVASLVKDVLISSAEVLADGFRELREVMTPYIAQLIEATGIMDDPAEKARGEKLDAVIKANQEKNKEFGKARTPEEARRILAEEAAKHERMAAEAAGAPVPPGAPVPLAPPTPVPLTPVKPTPPKLIPDPVKPKSFKDEFLNGQDTVLKELTVMNGKPAQSMGVANAAREAQMAALNVSPTDRKMLEFTQKSTQTLMGILEQIRKNNGGLL